MGPGTTLHLSNWQLLTAPAWGNQTTKAKGLPVLFNARVLLRLLLLLLQWCDAKGQPCIIIEQDATGSNRDVVVVDLAPLRSNSLTWAVNSSLALAHAAGARRIDTAERPLHAVPFDAIPVELPASVEEVGGHAAA